MLVSLLPLFLLITLLLLLTNTECTDLTRLLYSLLTNSETYDDKDETRRFFWVLKSNICKDFNGDAFISLSCYTPDILCYTYQIKMVLYYICYSEFPQGNCSKKKGWERNMKREKNVKN
jgi:hypothetical protein